MATLAPGPAASSELHRELAGATILLVEDEQALAESTMASFAASGSTVWHAESGGDARAMLKRAAPDAILLDLSLPDVDGLVLCSLLRAEVGDVPIIVCSAATDRHVTVLAFHIGADDVVSKPFNVDELQARVAVALRRRHARGPITPLTVLPTQRPRLTSGALVVDVPAWRATIGGRPVRLTPTEFRLLVFLIQRAGEFVKRDDLAREVWGNVCLSNSRTIDAYMRRVRDKLLGTGGPQLLHVRGMGYQLVNRG